MTLLSCCSAKWVGTCLDGLLPRTSFPALGCAPTTTSVAERSYGERSSGICFSSGSTLGSKAATSFSISLSHSSIQSRWLRYSDNLCLRARMCSPRQFRHSNSFRSVNRPSRARRYSFNRNQSGMVPRTVTTVLCGGLGAQLLIGFEKHHCNSGHSCPARTRIESVA